MIIPPYLKKGDKVAIVATARKVQMAEIEPPIQQLMSWGLEVVLMPNLLASDHQYAGTDDQRAADMQQAMDDDSIKAILFARGGYGTMRIMDKLNFDRFQQKPKWICGYSDITVLHSHIHQQLGIATIHSVMLSGFLADEQAQQATLSLYQALFGTLTAYQISPSHVSLQREGTTKGPLVGGNLSLLFANIGSSSDLDTTGKILFIEDLDEYLYHIDRMMVNMKRTGKLAHLKGLIVGGMSDMKDNTIPFGKTAEEIVYDAVKEYDYPVCYGFPAGHIVDNRALPLGQEVELFIGQGMTNLNFL